MTGHCTVTALAYGGQAAEAVCSTSNSLPFTGFALLPVLIIALAATALGILLLRRVR